MGLMQVFFLDSATRLNPHLLHAQAIHEQMALDGNHTAPGLGSRSGIAPRIMRTRGDRLSLSSQSRQINRTNEYGGIGTEG